MAKKLVRLTESDLHRIIKESVKSILKESELRYGTSVVKDEYSDNDLEYQNIYDNAIVLISRYPELYNENSYTIAKKLGFDLETIQKNDLEVLMKAIKDAKDKIFWDEINPLYK